MSILSWFSRGKVLPKPVALPESSGLSRMEPTRPVHPRRPGASAKEAVPAANGQPANRKSERMARRELLYGVVRECMVHAGVLSSSYKFKVLSLDARGRQFLAMVDLASEHGGETHRLAEIEAMIAQSAKSRHDIMVTAVYWRLNEHVAVGHPLPERAIPRGAPSRPMPLEAGAQSHPSPSPLAAEPVAAASANDMLKTVPMRVAPSPAAVQPAAHSFEPIQAEEVAAFRQALEAGARAPALAAQPAAGATARAPDGTLVHGPQSYTLLTGFEDTEMPDPNRAPALSATQYGELR